MFAKPNNSIIHTYAWRPKSQIEFIVVVINSIPSSVVLYIFSAEYRNRTYHNFSFLLLGLLSTDLIQQANQVFLCDLVQISRETERRHFISDSAGSLHVDEEVGNSTSSIRFDEFYPVESLTGTRCENGAELERKSRNSR